MLGMNTQIVPGFAEFANDKIIVDKGIATKQ